MVFPKNSLPATLLLLIQNAMWIDEDDKGDRKKAWPFGGK